MQSHKAELLLMMIYSSNKYNGYNKQTEEIEMIKCILFNEEISEEECKNAIEESYKSKPQISKKFKRIIGWKFACKECPNHKK